MTDTSVLGFPEAARRLGVSLRVLRSAIRAGRLPAPPVQTATAVLPADWFASAEAAVKATPGTLTRAGHQKVPPFARYQGTSAWRKFGKRVHAYAQFRAAAEKAA